MNMEETYFVISNSDGNTTVTKLTKEQLLEAINENYWGKILIFIRHRLVFNNYHYICNIFNFISYKNKKLQWKLTVKEV